MDAVARNKTRCKDHDCERKGADDEVDQSQELDDAIASARRPRVASSPRYFVTPPASESQVIAEQLRGKQ